MPKVKFYFEETKSIYREHGLQSALDYWANDSEWFAYMNDNPITTNRIGHRRLLNDFRGKHFSWDTPSRDVIKVLDRFCRFKGKTLLYNGEFDLEEFKNAAKALFNVEPRIQLKTVQSAGGFPAWENEVAVLKIAKDFLVK